MQFSPEQIEQAEAILGGSQDNVMEAYTITLPAWVKTALRVMHSLEIVVTDGNFSEVYAMLDESNLPTLLKTFVRVGLQWVEKNVSVEFLPQVIG